jgi:uncharacterized protein YjbI with pentapeptide repeats
MQTQILRALGGLLVLVCALAGASWRAEARPARLIQAAEELAGWEDPEALLAQGRLLREAGQEALARACFEAAIKAEELNHYADLHGSPYGDALLAEHMGEWERSRGLWRSLMRQDVVTTWHRLRRLSVDPEREGLLKEARAVIDQLVAEAREGKEPAIHTTQKGEVRRLKRMSSQEALAAFKAGERLRYVFVEELDLSGEAFSLPVQCSRCVFGRVSGWGSAFGEELNLARALVLGDVHLGKKWRGEVNKSAFEAPGRASRLYLDSAVVLGSVNLDSVKIEGRVLGLPLMVVEGDLDLRDAQVEGVTELRYAWVGGALLGRGAALNGSNYLGQARFGEVELSRVVVREAPLYLNGVTVAGALRLERAELLRGATLEGARLGGPVSLQHARVSDRLNFSRVRFAQGVRLSQVQATDLDFLGAEVSGAADFSDAVFSGSVRFSPDGLTRRLHLRDAAPLHKLYKQYQGDDDAAQDLTSGSYYGVTHVDDLITHLSGEVSFANTIFEKFVNFEGVRFGVPGARGVANFYNTQFYGEAHFERTRFYATADFRTIFGNEVSFNEADFYQDLLLDDANVPGRLSFSGADLHEAARLSFYGARVDALGLSFRQLREGGQGAHRLFYERCAVAEDYEEALWEDPRLLEARWDAEREVEVRDPAARAARARSLCMERAVGEFVALKDSFGKRGMGEETDWAYWHLRHYKNLRSRSEAATPWEAAPGWLEWLVSEKGFGWGVRLPNLLGTGLVVVLLFVALLRLLCGEMLLDWDNETVRFKDLPRYGMLMVSLHLFLGRARDWKIKTSPISFKFLYTLEIISGIILITFFIGAYTRLVLR